MTAHLTDGEWTVRVFWYLLRYGYKNSPYEEEARTLSGH
jgi:hypothetical protein